MLRGLLTERKFCSQVHQKLVDSCINILQALNTSLCFLRMDCSLFFVISQVRSSKLAKHSKYAPADGNRYDGIYKVRKCSLLCIF